MVVESVNIHVSAEFSEDKTLRFSLKKVWDSSKPKALFILLNPSKADVVRVDNTFGNIINQSVENGYGSVTLVNLFPLMATEQSELRGKLDLGKEQNSEVVKREVNSINDIFIAWGTESNKYRERKSEFEELLRNDEGGRNIRCWFDKDGSYPKHLRVIGKDWSLDNYEFSNIT